VSFKKRGVVVKENVYKYRLVGGGIVRSVGGEKGESLGLRVESRKRRDEGIAKGW
jgi:hypothetical protein